MLYNQLLIYNSMKKRLFLIWGNLLLLLFLCGQASFAASDDRVIPFHLTLSDSTAGSIYTHVDHNYKYREEHGYRTDTLSGDFDYHTSTDSTVYVDIFLNQGFRFLGWSDGEPRMYRSFPPEYFDTLSAVNVTAIVEVIPIYHIELRSSDPEMGTVLGGGDYEAGDPIYKQAIAKSGYVFDSWKSSNGYSLTNAEGNDTLVALFREVQYTCGIYPFLSIIEYYRGNQIEDTTISLLDTIRFVNTRDNRTIYKYGDTLNALVGDTLMATAIPYEGHRFLKWSDGSTDNPKMFVCGATSYDKSIVARAIFQTYREDSVDVVPVRLSASDEKMGRVYANVSHHNHSWISDTLVGDFEYMVGRDTNLTIYAIPEFGYEFSHWSDGSTKSERHENEFTNMKPGDTLFLTAYFTAKSLYNITLISSDSAMGSVKGGGSLPAGSMIFKEAIPNMGYKFKEWKSLRGYSLTQVQGHDTIVAYFEPVVCEVRVQSYYFWEYEYHGYISHDSTDYGIKDIVYVDNLSTNTHDTLNGMTVYEVSIGDTLIFTAYPESGHEFKYWRTNGIEMSNPYKYVCQGESYINIIACFYDTVSAVVPPMVDSVYVKAFATNDSLGYVSGGGYYTVGDTALLRAVAYENSVFDRWSDGETSRVRSVVCRDTMTYWAIFKRVGGWSDNLANEPVEVDTVKNAISMIIDLSSLSLDEEQMKHVAFSASVDVAKNSDSEVRVECYADSTCTELLGSFTLKSEDVQMTRSTTKAYKLTSNISESSVIPEGTKYLKVVMEDANADTYEELKSAFQNLELTVARKSYRLNLATDEVMGQVYGAGEFFGGDFATIKAVPRNGYKFMGWSDGELAEERDVLVSQDMEIKALFDKTTDVEDVQIDSPDDIVDVVTLQGYVIKHQVRRADALKGLTEGVYIVGKQKVLWME